MAFINSNRGDLSHTTTTGSWIGVDLEVVFFVGFQSTWLEAHIRFLDDGWCVPWWWEDVVVVWQMRDLDVLMTWKWWWRGCVLITWCPDEVRRSRLLSSFLDANSVEYVAIDICTVYFPTNISHQECFFKEFYAISLTQRPSSLVRVEYMVLTFRIYGICLRVVFGAPSVLVLSTRRLPRQSLVFWGVSLFLWLEPMLITLEILTLARSCFK